MRSASRDGEGMRLGIQPARCLLASILTPPARAVVVASLISFAGCAFREGRVAIELIWDAESPPSNERSKYDLYVAIEERTDVERSGPVLHAARAKLDNPAPLALGQVPNGDDRVAVIEVRRLVGTSTVVAYSGRSEKFSLKAGDRKTISAHLKLRPPPRFGEVVSLSILGANAGRVRQPGVILRLQAYNAHRIVIAKDTKFTIGVSEADAATSKVQDSTMTEGLIVYDVAYDLDAGLDCGAGECTDGLRAVYAKAFSTDGVAGGVASAHVDLDTIGPVVIPESVGVVLIPSAENVLRSVTRVRGGTTARINFTLSKPVREEPRLVVSSGTSSLAFTLLASTGTSYVYKYQAFGTEAEGPYGASVTATDLAGNTRTSTLALPDPGIRIDRTAPRPSDPARVVYHRVPWGSEATRGISAFSITSRPGAVEAGTTVIAYDRPNRSGRFELGRTSGTASPEGVFSDIALNPADRIEVYVAAVDEAGNESPATLVKEVEWVATFGGKVAGSRSPNPHRLETGSVVSDALTPSDSFLREPASLDIARVTRPRMDGRPLAASGGETWKQVVPRGGPSARIGPAMAYDAARGRVVLFGGTSGSQTFQDTWEWDGSNWKVRSPPRSPPARDYPAMAYDAARGRVLLFGGMGGPTGFLRDTWEWDGSNWTERTPVSSPPGRYEHAMAYDAARGRVVLFGGTGFGLVGLEDTWEWDGVNWTPRSPASPPATAPMAYDAARGRVVLFGGGASGQDTWEWDGFNWVTVQG